MGPGSTGGYGSGSGVGVGGDGGIGAGPGGSGSGTGPGSGTGGAVASISSTSVCLIGGPVPDGPPLSTITPDMGWSTTAKDAGWTA